MECARVFFGLDVARESRRQWRPEASSAGQRSRIPGLGRGRKKVVVVKTDTGSVAVKVEPPLLVFSREPGDLAQATKSSW